MTLPRDAAVVLMALLPVFELRLAIPVGILYFHFPLPRVFILALLGNLIPVIPLLLFFRYFFHKLTAVKIIGPFFRWWFKSVEGRSKAVRKWGFWGLVLFVAVPLPVTGAWTGSVAATLIELDTRRSFLAIALGVMMAGVLVSLISILVPEVIRLWFTFT